MSKLFIHQPVFRILSPLFIGVMTYLLILLLNNDTSQIALLYESQEVYVCIMASYLVLEANRLIVVISSRFENGLLEWQRILFVGGLNCLSATILASVTLGLYFKIWVGFSPSQSEWWVFNSIFAIVSLLYLTLYFSHSLLHKENALRLINEQLVKESISSEFTDFKNDINPKLLYTSLERIISLAHENPDKAEELIDYLSGVYRYMLGHKQTELVYFEEEVSAINQLVNLLNMLPDFNIDFNMDCEVSNIQVIPGTMTTLVEDIAKRTISNPNVKLTIYCYCEEEYLVLQHRENDRLSLTSESRPLDKSQRAYSFYTDTPIVQVSAYDESYTKIPILKLEQEPTI